MENKNQLNLFVKYLLVLFAVGQLYFLINQGFSNGLYLDGNVMLGLEDTRSVGFSMNIPFEMSRVSFYPEHHFACLIQWEEVAKELPLIAYCFLSNLPTLLALILAFYIFLQLSNTEKSFHFLQNKLTIFLFASFILQFLCKIGSEYCKITFFQKYIPIENANWYLYNEVFSKPTLAHFGGSLSAILLLLLVPMLLDRYS